jgi:hypothetical protein
MKTSLALCLASCLLALVPGCSVIVSERRSCDGDDGFCPDGSVCESGECREVSADGDGDSDGDGDGDGDGDSDVDGDGDGDCPAQVRTVDAVITASNVSDYRGVTRIIGSLSIVSTTLLMDVNELSCLEEVTGMVLIDSNLVLEDISGLDHLTTVGSDLQVTNNPALSSCDAEHIYENAELDDMDVCIQRNSEVSTSCEMSDGC